MKIPPITSTASAADAAATQPVPSSATPEHNKKTAPDNTAIDPQSLQQLADKLAEAVGMSGQQVQFSVDHDTGKTVLRVTDAESGALLRQIPGDEALAMARILDQMKGVLIRQKA